MGPLAGGVIYTGYLFTMAPDINEAAFVLKVDVLEAGIMGNHKNLSLTRTKP